LSGCKEAVTGETLRLAQRNLELESWS